jgi:hypothetical protein
MSTMILEVYDALKSAGAPEEKAQAAATVLANTDNRFDKLDREIAVLEAKLNLIQWLIGGVVFGVLLLVIKSFWPHG